MEIVLIGHSELGVEMKNACEMIVGEQKNLHSLGFYDHEGIENIENKLHSIISRSEGETIIFTDIAGGSPYNASCSYSLKHPQQKIYVLAGMSLPLVIELVLSHSNEKTGDLIADLHTKSKEVFTEFKVESFDEDEEEL